MPNLFEILKALMTTVLVVWALQFKVGDKSIEQRAYEFSAQSSTAQYLHQVAKGAVLVIRESMNKVTSVVTDKTRDDHTAKAGRLQFDLKRSPAYEASKGQN